MSDVHLMRDLKDDQIGGSNLCYMCSRARYNSGTETYTCSVDDEVLSNIDWNEDDYDCQNFSLLK